MTTAGSHCSGEACAHVDTPVRVSHATPRRGRHVLAGRRVRLEPASVESAHRQHAHDRRPLLRGSLEIDLGGDAPVVMP